jgi:hypothetical protein
MNRYSIVFALLVASSFAVHTSQTGNGASVASGSNAADAADAKDGTKKHAPTGSTHAERLGSVPFIKAFLNKASSDGGPLQGVKILFATVPHPTETNLAPAFDHNVDALQDGLQESGYLFDSSWIAWSDHKPRAGFDDDEKERVAKGLEDNTPGILLFRKNDRTQDPYANGIIVFLISEKPTEGIELSQVESALDILGQSDVPFSGPIQIVGPTFSGSFASMVPMVELLIRRNPAAKILIRSGAVTVKDAAQETVCSIAKKHPGTSIDFGSVHHDYPDWIRAISQTLVRMSIDREHTAILSEGESLYGSYALSSADSDLSQPESTNGCRGKNSERHDSDGMWKLAFPRDISSLREGYDKQGIFDSSSSTQPWRRILNLKNDQHNQGDSVESFGGSATVAAQEAILLGISEFLKAHGVRAVIISATNEEDRYFLTQFLHAHNGDVRIAVIGNTRTFLRGSTAQFRGDLMVDDFPMLPRLHDWTSEKSDRTARTFADDVAQGIYFAAIDLLAPRSDFGSQASAKRSQLYPEYSAPPWDEKAATLRPPMYVVALGGESSWPVAEDPGTPFIGSDSGMWRVEMPFQLFGHDQQIGAKDPAQPAQFNTGHLWKIVCVFLVGLTVFYCSFFWCANPITRIAFASFEPSPSGRFWIFKVSIPAAIAGCAFKILAWAVAIPNIASYSAVWWWHCSEALSVLASLAIAMAALTKALGLVKLDWNRRMALPFVAPALAAISLAFDGFLNSDPFSKTSDVGSILNKYREMHMESGLSLVPTGMFLLLAILIWTSQAGNGAALLATAPPLPRFPGNQRISRKRACLIVAIGRPMPNLRRAKWLWTLWLVMATILLLMHFKLSSFLEITTLEATLTTRLVLLGCATIVALTLMDLLQFLWLWNELGGLLRALNREAFRRSFVPIEDVRWPNMWSFSGISFEDRRAIDAAMGDSVCELAKKHLIAGFAKSSAKLEALHTKYSAFPLPQMSTQDFAKDRLKFLALISIASRKAAVLLDEQRFRPVHSPLSPGFVALTRAIGSRDGGDKERFADEREETAQLPKWLQEAEKLICLTYIGFIRTVVARLHTLLISVASMFSLLVLGIAIYPFVPLSPLLLSGLALLLGIGWAFFKVFSEMDKDPILARITNSDDRKLQGTFYMKFAEALALPLLTIGSSILPGGAGRLLELAQSFINHAQ